MMLDGFPKQIRTTKQARGKYRITRDDGRAYNVERGIRGRWWVNGMPRDGSSLREIKSDISNGYTPADQLGGI
ncbi:hypothetical protein [Pacificispira sp.]|uniref:hypothetical protein n=1 Tax=Pacificispira sp. TaxID=2888761 RepID=UPI003BABC827